MRRAAPHDALKRSAEAGDVVGVVLSRSRADSPYVDLARLDGSIGRYNLINLAPLVSGS